MPHHVSIDETYNDQTDTAAAAAFCEDCAWRGEWHHNDDPRTDFFAEAEADANDHTHDTTEEK
jgi:hypothetical protein